MGFTSRITADALLPDLVSVCNHVLSFDLIGQVRNVIGPCGNPNNTLKQRETPRSSSQLILLLLP